MSNVCLWNFVSDDIPQSKIHFFSIKTGEKDQFEAIMLSTGKFSTGKTSYSQMDEHFRLANDHKILWFWSKNKEVNNSTLNQSKIRGVISLIFWDYIGSSVCNKPMSAENHVSPL